jgi:hypothetical protein
MFNTTFNNISAILWRSVLLVEKTRVPEENHWLVTSQWQTLSHDVSSTPHHEWYSNSQPLKVICTDNDCTGSCKTNYHTIMTMTAPKKQWGMIYTYLVSNKLEIFHGISYNIQRKNSNEWLLFNNIWAIFHGGNKLHLNDDDDVPFVLDQHTLSRIFIVLAHWNNSPRIGNIDRPSRITTHYLWKIMLFL